MKPEIFFLSFVLLTTSIFAEHSSASVDDSALYMVKVVKKTTQPKTEKSQPGSADLLKEDKAYMKMRMNAQSHLKPEIVHISKEGERDEKQGH